MNDETKDELMKRTREWLQSCVNAATRSGVPEEADLEAFILAHLDGEPERLAAALENLREACARQFPRGPEISHTDPWAAALVRATPLDATPLREALERANEGVRYWTDLAQAEARDAAALRARVAELEAFGRKVSAIRDSIVGAQAFNWSEHAYPLVAALGEAGFKGVSYQIARENLGTLIDRASKAESRVAELETQAAARYDCKGGPGTTAPACGGCVTCLHLVIEQAEARAEKAEGELLKFRGPRCEEANCADHDGQHPYHYNVVERFWSAVQDTYAGRCFLTGVEEVPTVAQWRRDLAIARQDADDLRSTCAMLRAQVTAARAECARIHDVHPMEDAYTAATNVLRAMDEAAKK